MGFGSTNHEQFRACNSPDLLATAEQLHQKKPIHPTRRLPVSSSYLIPSIDRRVLFNHPHLYFAVLSPSVLSVLFITPHHHPHSS